MQNLGEEAAHIGSAAALKKQDMVFAQYREVSGFAVGSRTKVTGTLGFDHWSLGRGDMLTNVDVLSTQY